MYFWDDVKSALVFLLMLVCGAAIIIAMDNRIDAWRCAGVHEATGKETKFRGGQCFALVGEVYVPLAYVYGTAVELRNPEQEQ
jgi:hypothetical protein